jgi:hypothetical protein
VSEGLLKEELTDVISGDWIDELEEGAEKVKDIESEIKEGENMAKVKGT